MSAADLDDQPENEPGIRDWHPPEQPTDAPAIPDMGWIGRTLSQANEHKRRYDEQAQARQLEEWRRASEYPDDWERLAEVLEPEEPTPADLKRLAREQAEQRTNAITTAIEEWGRWTGWRYPLHGEAKAILEQVQQAREQLLHMIGDRLAEAGMEPLDPTELDRELRSRGRALHRRTPPREPDVVDWVPPA